MILRYVPTSTYFLIEINFFILGTFLIRQRANGQFALLLATYKGVKSMKIEEKVTDKIKFYFLSENRKFKALVKIVSHYKHEDLTENFRHVLVFT